MLRTWVIQIPSCACDVIAPPGPAARRTLGECPCGDGVVVARSYSTPDGPWHTIWRTLANPGE
ncbi:hypothetical protein GCM10010297_23870 [Streptomyces malachitofuscus]|nr:hypothetical protein GCM10010297_23870 [Streptomyces malachitofuscus]